MGRNSAGLHWRSDLAEGLKLGEAAAIAVLREVKLTDNEIFSGWSLKCFDGRCSASKSRLLILSEGVAFSTVA
jgi:hypothetical protein